MPVRIPQLARRLRAALPSLAVALLLALVAGCDEERKPVPYLNIRVLADGQYELNRERMDLAKLKDEIARLADENRRDIGSTARVYVRIATQAGASQSNKSVVMNACLANGIHSIEQSGADE